MYKCLNFHEVKNFAFWSKELFWSIDLFEMAYVDYYLVNQLIQDISATSDSKVATRFHSYVVLSSCYVMKYFKFVNSSIQIKMDQIRLFL